MTLRVWLSGFLIALALAKGGHSIELNVKTDNDSGISIIEEQQERTTAGPSIVKASLIQVARIGDKQLNSNYENSEKTFGGFWKFLNEHPSFQFGSISNAGPGETLANTFRGFDSDESLEELEKQSDEQSDEFLLILPTINNDNLFKVNDFIRPEVTTKDSLRVKVRGQNQLIGVGQSLENSKVSHENNVKYSISVNLNDRLGSVVKNRVANVLPEFHHPKSSIVKDTEISSVDPLITGCQIHELERKLRTNSLKKQTGRNLEEQDDAKPTTFSLAQTIGLPAVVSSFVKPDSKKNFNNEQEGRTSNLSSVAKQTNNFSRNQNEHLSTPQLKFVTKEQPEAISKLEKSTDTLHLELNLKPPAKIGRVHQQVFISSNLKGNSKTKLNQSIVKEIHKNQTDTLRKSRIPDLSSVQKIDNFAPHAQDYITTQLQSDPNSQTKIFVIRPRSKELEGHFDKSSVADILSYIGKSIAPKIKHNIKVNASRLLNESNHPLFRSELNKNLETGINKTLKIGTKNNSESSKIKSDLITQISRPSDVIQMKENLEKTELENGSSVEPSGSHLYEGNKPSIKNHTKSNNISHSITHSTNYSAKQFDKHHQLSTDLLKSNIKLQTLKLTMPVTQKPQNKLLLDQLVKSSETHFKKLSNTGEVLKLSVSHHNDGFRIESNEQSDFAEDLEKSKEVLRPDYWVEDHVGSVEFGRKIPTSIESERESPKKKVSVANIKKITFLGPPITTEKIAENDKLIWNVQDPYINTNFGLTKPRFGPTNLRSYYSLLPNGRRQPIEYYNERTSGYNPEMNYYRDRIQRNFRRYHNQ